MDMPASQTYASLGMLGVFSLVGIAGNGLVLYGFSKSKPKQTSTIFILTLAVIDFTSCILTVPSTITMELLEFRVPYDIICKFHHFLVTSTIPFSASIMVAIAFDRYFCICRPLQHIITRCRAGVMVICLALLAIGIGVISCLMYGVREKGYFFIIDEPYIQCSLNISINNGAGAEKIGTNSTKECDRTLYCGQLLHGDSIFGLEFTFIFEKIYSSFYGVCCIIIIVLYIIIYKFILGRRKRRLRADSFNCCALNKSPLCDPENTEVIYMSQEPSRDQVITNEKDIGDNQQCLLNHERKAINREMSTADRQREEKFRINNIKTALMLSVVAFVFILAFLPAWLMKLGLIHFNMVVFYLYFIYNVANPFIYAFMNPEFQQKMGIVIRDLKKRWTTSTV